MPSAYTPLRYPGGKAKFGPFLATVLRASRLVDSAYAEPYAGGAGAGLHLLFRGLVSRVHLNDIDRGLTSFWKAALVHNERFAREVERIPLTVREWDRQRQALRTLRCGFDLGLAFFYLNRTNRSGIMNGGVIGGRAQTGAWGIDARFNRAELAARVRALAPLRRQISITRLDALAFLDEMAGNRSKTLTYLDPPYFGQGQKLYPNFYTPADHAEIASYLRSYRHPWLMTYDSCDEIRSLYRSRRLLESELSYSAREVRRGRELVILGPGLREPKGNALRIASPARRAGFALL